MSKRATVILDIDGTVLWHHGRGATAQWDGSCGNILLPGVREFFDSLESKSACIILMTARKESCRSYLESVLRSHGIFWDHLIMNVGHGTRYLFNDSKAPGSKSAIAVTVQRNSGLEAFIDQID